MAVVTHAELPVVVRPAGAVWLVEAYGQVVAEVSTEIEAQKLAESWLTKLKWVASWRFGAR